MCEDMFSRFDIEPQLVTDRRTDRHRAIALYHASIALSGKHWPAVTHGMGNSRVNFGLFMRSSCFRVRGGGTYGTDIQTNGHSCAIRMTYKKENVNHCRKT